MRNQDYLIPPYYSCPDCGCQSDYIEYVDTEVVEYVKRASISDDIVNLVLENNYTKRMNRDSDTSSYQCKSCHTQIYINGQLLRHHITKWMHAELEALANKFKIPDFPYHVEHFIDPIECANCEEKNHVLFYYEENVYCSMCIQTDFEEMKMEHVL